jgi:putative membrane protein
MEARGEGLFLKRSQLPILLVNGVALALFTVLFASRKNYEFLMYIGVIIFFLVVILATNRRIDYPNPVLWGLTTWALMHMAGGGIYIGGIKLYEIILIPISETYSIFRYDQLVHIVGFGVATLVMFHLLKPLLKDDLRGRVALSIVVVMAGLGVGALNEIIEFLATVLVPETGVGGYTNTALDLVSDLVGAMGAMALLLLKKN